MNKEFTADDAKLLEDLGLEAQVTETASHTPSEERLIAGFEDVVEFFKEYHRLPEHGPDQDIFERLYALRLDCILASPAFINVLTPLDKHGIIELAKSETASLPDQEMTDTELLAALGVVEPEISQLKFVRPRAEQKAKADEISHRQPCDEFEKFKPFFEVVQREIESGQRRTIKYKDSGDYSLGDMFIVGGQKALIVAMSEKFSTKYDRSDRRLRVIYDNGTESGILLRSLQRSLNRDKNSRRITESSAEPLPLFSSVQEESDTATGHIYVVRSKSSNSFIVEHREMIHKIGMTTQDVSKRLSNVKKDPTFLLSDVQVMATYSLSNINPKKLERLLHDFFSTARLDVTLQDRFGEEVEPREWFMVPINVIDDAINLLIAGQLVGKKYDYKSAAIVSV